MSELTFLPWLRSGAAGALQPASPPTNRPDFKVTLTATRTDDNKHTDLTPTVVDMQMLGPGDVVGIKPSQVIRTEPADGSTGVETEIFAAVEFAEPTLPWMFTPDLEKADHQLQPWICLVVVRVQDGVTLDRASGRLTIGPPADAGEELPDLSEAWAWAHVQYAGDLKTDPSGATVDLGANASLTLSRLLSPRKLEADKQYVACVVPTYKDGANAGLGQASDPAGHAAAAWTGSDHAITLPVYYSFGFSTGANGDFRELAKLLMHPPGVSSRPGSGLGPRTLNVTDGKKNTSALQMSGMLQPANQTGAMQPPPQWVIGWLRSELTPSAATPQLRPPLYGGIQAGIRPRDLTPAPAGFDAQPEWWKTLNEDPRMRVAAALGHQVVAGERESLVAAAWDQVEQTREVNALLSRAQLARSVATTLSAKHLPAGDGSAATLKLLQLTSPQASRMQVQVGGAGGSVLSVLTETPAASPRLPAVAGATYRSLTRPRGVHALRTRSGPAPDPLIPMPTLRASLSAEYAVTNRVLAEWLSPSAASAVSAPDRGDALRELAPKVTYPYGMFTALAHIAPEAILPGASSIPPNTALTLGPNSELIAAYMVGLNTEIVRTLLWRGVPSDRRATPFKTFWDVRGQTGSGADIKDIKAWQKQERLVDELDSGGGYLLLAMRAELLRRYPRTAVFAIQATQPVGSKDHYVSLDNTATPPVQPAFTGMLPPDLRLYGFQGIQPADAIGSPGYFFVLQEQASETRFGSDPAFSAATPSHNHWLAKDLGIAHSNAALVADKVRMPPVAVAIHARALLPAG